MAKRDDDDLDVDDLDAEAEEVEEADDEVEEADEDVEDADDDGSSDDEDDEEPEEEPEPPRKKAKVTGLTLTLIILNMLAALGFVFLLMMNFEKRQQLTQAAIAHEALVVGVGTQEDHTGAPTAGVVTQPKPRLSPDELKAVMSKRGASAGSDPIAAVEDGFNYGLYGANVSAEARRELFKDLGPAVANVEEELRRLKNDLPTEIEKVAGEIVASLKDDASKRTKIANLLLPICFDTYQINELDKRIQAARGPALDNLLKDAVQRRIIADILNPVEIYRPGDVEESFIERVAVDQDADPKKAMKLDELKGLLAKRLEVAASDKHDGAVFLGKQWDGQPRWTVEKRHNAAFLLVSISYARNHKDGAKQLEDVLLYPRQLERTQRICGLYDFTAACANFTKATHKLQQRVEVALTADRAGFAVLDANNQLRHGEGFIDRQANAVRRIQDAQLAIRQAKDQLADLRDQADKAKKLYEERLAHWKDLEDRIRKGRAQTAKEAAELRVLQEQTFEAQKKLADAAEINLRLTRQIEQLSRGKAVQP